MAFRALGAVYAHGPMSLFAGRSWLYALGPGLLFAAASVGVSHLVQSTRAGAVYGLALLLPVIAANLVKYPAFRFGPQYAAATGTSLLEGYRRRGRWALLLYAALTLGTMFTIQAVVTVVTAGLAIAVLGLAASPVVVSAILIALCGVLLAFGRYRWLDRVTRVLVALLTASTFIAAAAALPRVDWSGPLWVDAGSLDTATVFFLAALVGWMPSAIDVSVWQSLWTVAKRADSGRPTTVKASLVDFHVGYIGTVLLALCFLVMGAGVMHQSGTPLADGAGAFAAQVIALYTSALGAWSGPIVGLSALAVMFSTTLTVLDGFPRAIATLVARFRSAEDPAIFDQDTPAHRRVYLAAIVLLGSGAVVVLWLMMKSFKPMVDVATTLSFLTAPLLSALNHRAITGSEVAREHRPKPWLVAMSYAGIALQGAFALHYLALRYG